MSGTVGTKQGIWYSYRIDPKTKELIYFNYIKDIHMVNKFENIRTGLKGAEHILRELKEAIPKNTNSEVIANVVLSIRHIEDARMRLGKAIQYSGDGISIYDKKDQPATPA